MNNSSTKISLNQNTTNYVSRLDVFSRLLALSGNGDFIFYPEILTEEELVIFLRIPEVSKSKDYHNVIENLKRMHDLPRIHICGKALYPRDAIIEWINARINNGK